MNYIVLCWDFPLLLNNIWGYVIVVSTLNSKQFLNNILLFKHLIQTCCYLFNRVIYKSFVSNFNVCLASWVPFSSSDSWHGWPVWGEIVCIAHAFFFHACFLSSVLTCTGSVKKPNNRKENSSFLCITAAGDNRKQIPEIYLAHFSGDLIMKNRKDPDFCVCFIKCCLPSLALLGFRD